MNKVSESIFSNEDIVIPLADISFVEKHHFGNPSKYRGLRIIMKHTVWDMVADTWANNAYISTIDDKDKKFMKAWLYYRHEIEGRKEAFKQPED